MNEIQKLKQQIQETEQAYTHWHTLLPQRERLQEMIQQMKEQIEAAMALLQKHRDSGLQTAELDSKVERERALLEKAKAQKREIDHLLDSLEEGSLDKIQQLQKQLIEQIIEIHPKQESIYAEMEEDRQRILEKMDALNQDLQVGQALETVLETIHSTRQSVRKKGVLSYLLGKNPNVVITQQLQHAEKLCEAALPSLEKRHSKELHAFVQDLLSHCQHSWGFKKIDTILAKDSAVLSKLQARTLEKLDAMEKALKAIESKIKAWMDSF